MIPSRPDADPALGLSENITPAELESLNHALASLVEGLRFAREIPLGDTGGRQAAVVALGEIWRFLMEFESIRTEMLHVPLMNLQGALLALEENNVEPMLRPTKRPGRAPSSPKRYALMGIAVGSAKRLEWTGLLPRNANKEVASKLDALGIKPTRGDGRINANTVRRWRERISEIQPLFQALPQVLGSDLTAEDLGWVSAAENAATMVSEQWRERIRAHPAADARAFVLEALETSIREQKLS